MCLQKINRIPLSAPSLQQEKPLRREGNSSTHEILQAIFASTPIAGNKRSTPLDGHDDSSAENHAKKKPTQTLTKELNRFPLVQATRTSSRSVAELERLIQSGEDVNQTDSVVNNSSLHYAAFYNHLKITKLLVSHDADVNLANRSGITPLMWAIEKGHTAIAKFLLSHPSLDMTSSDKQGFSALHKSVLNGNFEILRELLSVARTRTDSDCFQRILNATSNQGLTAAHQAAYHGNASVLQLLIQYGADLNVLSLSKTSPLHLASSRNHVDIARILVSQGVIVNQQDAHKRTPLHYACIFGHYDVALFLVKEARASLLLVDFQNNSPLSIAVRDGFEELSSLMMGSTNSSLVCSPPAESVPVLSPSLLNHRHHDVFDDLFVDSQELPFFFVPSPTTFSAEH